ncbi:hypothetical protein WH221_12335 [Chryseobacterium culicis]|uniref:DUF2975 domain-containing protein n=1 Tax=Chryseobacterium culicis TaxID=680127 RepID=A0A2S9D2M3_CHRCI|nr:hypothetical protein [Chryseobacterium culicis]PRB86990.1 hypothetical protein CQ022_12315 [Chryseobacterium culicis]PRB92742.1 hypothetical protein CQ033_05985 [Chryseobacterium culicis]
MKLIGEKSVSTLLSKILLAGSVAQLLYLGYIILGFVILYNNLHQGIPLFSETFTTGNFDNEIRKTATDSLTFQFEMPLTGAVIKGSYTLYTFISIIFFVGFYSVFTFYLFRIFKGMSADLIFNIKVIHDLKIFATLNIVFIPIYSIVLYCMDQSIYSIDPLFILLHLTLGIIIFFIIEFFKKGYELQTENELTI